MLTNYTRENQSIFKKRITIRQMEEMVRLGAARNRGHLLWSHNEARIIS